MIPNLHSIYKASEERARLSLIGLFILLAAALVTMLFVSPLLVFGVFFATAAIIITFLRPTWSLTFLALYLPLEPFILKWIPDELYVFVRYGSEFLIYILAAVVLWRIITGVVKPRQSPLDVPLVIFVVLLLASIAVNFTPPLEAVLGSRQILRFIILFFIAFYLALPKKFYVRLFQALCVILLLETTLGYAQAVFGQPVDNFLIPSDRKTLGAIQLTGGTTQFWDYGQRVFGTLGRYDQFGAFLAFVLLIIVAFLYEKVDQQQRPWLWGLLFLALPVLVLSYSRSSWFGFILGFLFLGLYIKRDKHVLTAIILIPIAIALYLGLTGLVVNKLIDTPAQTVAERFFEAFSFERWRGEYYGLGRLYWIVQTVTRVVPSAPLFGHGPASYGAGANVALHNTRVYDELGIPYGVYGTDGYIDNNWFSLWGETGTLGLVAYVWMFAALFVACVHIGRQSKDAETRALAFGVAAAMIALTLNAFLATYLEVRTLAPYIWLFGGGVLAVGIKEKVL